MTGCYGQCGSGHTSESRHSAVVNTKLGAKRRLGAGRGQGPGNEVEPALVDWNQETSGN